MYNLAASGFNGLYGFGSVNNDSIDINNLVIVNAGDHSVDFNISKQIYYP